MKKLLFKVFIKATISVIKYKITLPRILMHSKNKTVDLKKIKLLNESQPVLSKLVVSFERGIFVIFCGNLRLFFQRTQIFKNRGNQLSAGMNLKH